LPSFPVTNSYVEEDGTTILEIAATGLGKEDVSIDIDGNILKISGGKEKVEDSKKKVICKKLSDKKFSISYRCSSRQDLSQIKASIDKGLLVLTIPLKEEEKPIKRKVDIN
jgi:HSP20 family protein